MLELDVSSQLAGSIPANQVSGTLSLTQLPLAVVTNGASGINISGTFSGNGGGLTNLNYNEGTCHKISQGYIKQLSLVAALAQFYYRFKKAFKSWNQKNSSFELNEQNIRQSLDYIPKYSKQIPSLFFVSTRLPHAFALH